AREVPRVTDDFVFGEFNDNLIVLPRRVAADWGRLQHALGTCKTWGEMRKHAPRHLYNQALELLGRRKMPAARPIELDLATLLNEGFPPHEGSIMRLYIPEECKQFFKTQTNMLGE